MNASYPLVDRDPKVRRSRVDWFDLVPADVANRQMAWERRRTVMALHDAGLLDREIALRFGVSCHRIFQLRHRLERDGRSPVETYLSASSECRETAEHVGLLKHLERRSRWR